MHANKPLVARVRLSARGSKAIDVSDSLAVPGKAMAQKGGAAGVRHQVSDGHRPDAAGNGRERARDVARAFEVDVTDELRLAVERRNPIDPNIDDNGARL